MTFRVAVIVATTLSLLLGCTSETDPQLPPSSDVAAVADRITGPDGQAFLRDITSASWDDDGRRAAETFAWIPENSLSSNPTAATRAGIAAHAIATFLADERDDLADAPANLALWQAYADSLIPYFGAMVGDESGVEGFKALDGLESQMRRTASLFGTIAGRPEVNTIFAAAASERAKAYETTFARIAIAEPQTADRGNAQQDLMRAARLRGVMAAGNYLANPGSDRPTPSRAQTQLAYQVAALTARAGDPHLNAEFFINGRLRSPNEITDTDWSIYDSQLTVYLASWPRINAAIQQFGQMFSLIASA
jgi:hypothetical protein